MKSGGAGTLSGEQMLNRLERFGSSLQVVAGSDHSSFEFTVITDDVPDALATLGTLVAEPRLPVAEFNRLRQQEVEAAKARARGDFAWGNRLILYRELFDVPTGIHPYARFGATASDLERLQLRDCEAWRAQHLTPNNAQLIVVGSLQPQAVFEAADRAFAKWQGGPAPTRLGFNRPTGPERLQIHLVDHEDSSISEVATGVLGAPQQSAAWPALSLATHLLGVGSGSRLFFDLRERTQLALQTNAKLVPLAAAPAVVELTATTTTANTIAVVRAFLAHIRQLQESPPSTAEIQHSARAMTGEFLNHPDPLHALAHMLGVQARLNLAPDYYDAHHQAVVALDAERLHEIVEPYFDPKRAVVVVSGDAKLLAKPLSKLTSVAVLDPDKGFSIDRTLAYDPLGGS
jgi:predicted Zn-dependent peptidase